mmetsp:Transcript_27864/g.63225  ORF Transcript_27864/g.63225 Transcript_27864/m.63225 type:complete len:199 (-) Transcript_27864:14-610(-)
MHRQLKCPPIVEKAKSWLAFIELEESLGEIERARRLCELAIEEEMETPELIWKRYIDLEIANDEVDRARALWERLLERTQHVRVFSAFADFEAKDAKNIENARAVLRKGVAVMKQEQKNEERSMLLEHWLTLEREVGNNEHVAELESKQAKKVKKRRKDEDGIWEEYVDFVFPDDGPQKNLKILEMAQAWKRRKLAQT